MIHRALLYTSLTAILALAIVGRVEAQQVEVTSPPATELATSDETILVKGTVVSSTSSEVVIDTDTGARLTFAVDDTTTLPTSLTAGERVHVHYHALSGGKYHAADIAAAAFAEELDEVDVTADAQRRDPGDLRREPLPATASPLALIGLLGLVTASGGLLIRAARRP